MEWIEKTNKNDSEEIKRLKQKINLSVLTYCIFTIFVIIVTILL